MILRRNPDRMPAHLWRGVAPAGGVVECRASAVQRGVMTIIAVLFPIAGVAGFIFVTVLGADHASVALRLLVLVWAVGMVSARWRIRHREVFLLRLTDDVVEACNARGAPFRRVPVSDIDAIVARSVDKYVSFRADKATIRFDKTAPDLPRFIIELRRRNPAIRYKGWWPPFLPVWRWADRRGADRR